MTLHAGPPILPFHFQTVERRKYEKFPMSGIIFPTHFTFKAQLTRGLNGKESHVQLIGETKKVIFGLASDYTAIIAILAKERATKNEEAEPRIGVMTKVAYRDPTTVQRRCNARSLPCANDMAHIHARHIYKRNRR